MRPIRWLGLGLLALGLVGGQSALSPSRAGEAKVETKTVKLDALKDLIKQQKGKVVVVDFWADT